MQTMKKALLMLALGACVKLSILGPLILGLLGLKTIKAIMLLAIALLKGKNTSSHGSSGGDGHLRNIVTVSQDFMDSINGGWDRNIDMIFPQRPAPPPSTSLIPYHNELGWYEYSYKPTRTRT